MPHLGTIVRLGVKELWSLGRDPMMMGLIVYTFTVAICISATAMPRCCTGADRHRGRGWIAAVRGDRRGVSSAAIEPALAPDPASGTDAGLDSGCTPSPWTFRRISSATCWRGGRRRSSSMWMPPG